MGLLDDPFFGTVVVIHVNMFVLSIFYQSAMVAQSVTQMHK